MQVTACTSFSIATSTEGRKVTRSNRVRYVAVARSPNRFGPLRQRASRCPLCSKTRYSQESVFDPNEHSMRSGLSAVLARILL